MKRLTLFGFVMLLLTAGNTHPERIPEISQQEPAPAVDSLYQATKKLELSAIKLDQIVEKMK